jgi:hypothetical protein
MMEAVRTSETSVDNYFTRQYIPEDNSEHHTRRRENLKSHMVLFNDTKIILGDLNAEVGQEEIFLGTIGRSGRDADHSPPSSAEVENE